MMPGGDSDPDEPEDPQEPGVELEVVEHRFACWEDCEGWHMRSELLLRVRSPEPIAVELEWTATSYGDTPDYFWGSAPAVVDLPAETWTDVVLRESVHQCGPMTEGTEREGSYRIEVDEVPVDLQGATIVEPAMPASDCP
jgi:hypothetical protein